MRVYRNTICNTVPMFPQFVICFSYMSCRRYRYTIINSITRLCRPMKCFGTEGSECCWCRANNYLKPEIHKARSMTVRQCEVLWHGPGCSPAKGIFEPGRISMGPTINLISITRRERSTIDEHIVSGSCDPFRWRTGCS